MKMEEIDLSYDNDRYLAFVVPWSLQQVVGQYFQRWFTAHRCSEDIDPEFADFGFPDEITQRVKRTRKAIVALSRLARCWITAPTASTLPTSMQRCTVELLLALRAFLRDAQDGWNDVRHRCYQVLATNHELEGHPSSADQWELLERLSISQARNDNQDVLRIHHENDDWDVYVSRKQTTEELRSISIRGWFNDSRRRLADASAQFAASLGPLHSQLFVLGGLLANVTWGDSWYGAVVRPSVPASIMGRLSERIASLLRGLSFLVPAQVAQLRIMLCNSADSAMARAAAEEIGEAISQFIYQRVHHGIFDPRAERILLAYDLCHSAEIDAHRRSIANNLATLYQSQRFRKNVLPFNSDDELRTVAEGYRPVDTLRLGLNANQASRTTLPIWERITVQQLGNELVLISLDGCDLGEVDRIYGAFLQELVTQQGSPISARVLEERLGIAHVVLRRFIKHLPVPIRSYIEATQGRGTRLVNEPVR
jgi:hypothetical protein